MEMGTRNDASGADPASETVTQGDDRPWLCSVLEYSRMPHTAAWIVSTHLAQTAGSERVQADEMFSTDAVLLGRCHSEVSAVATGLIYPYFTRCVPFRVR
jgi:hypothetical protein